ncbi:MAG: hypothetical protein MUP76_09655 [Acidimicrobiia bacterium]|nr:hypothetical protein [Acidimicrobiia bacterium]
MGQLERDLVALEWFSKSWMPPCLRILVAARDIDSITRFVGEIERELSRSGSLGALLVRVPCRSPRPEQQCDLDLPVWKVEAAEVFHANPQVWVHVDYRGYRPAYARAFPDLDLDGFVVDHIENRRRSRKIGWKYVRLCHVTNPVNVSSGQGAERLGVDFAGGDSGSRMRWGDIRYADVADLAKMLGIRMGGGPQDGLRDVLPLFEPRAGRSHRGPCRCDQT